MKLENQSDGWSIAFIPDGNGYHYTAEHSGLMWASGWVRCADQPTARAIVVDIGKLAQERAA